MEVICLESEALMKLVKEVVNRLRSEHGLEEQQWISTEEAMKLLHINSKTTLQKYRDEGRIRYTQHSKKVILYDRDSIREYLEDKAQNRY